LAITMPIAWETTGKPARQDPVTLTGTITGWSVEEKGDVYVRLEGTHQGKSFQRWFVTPARRTETTDFEELVLYAIIALQGDPRGIQVTIESEPSNEVSGARREDALPLKAISRL